MLLTTRYLRIPLILSRLDHHAAQRAVPGEDGGARAERILQLKALVIIF
jgi:hypothetical protein